MSNLLILVVGWVKTHIVASVIIGTIVVGGAVAIPIILMNQGNDLKPKEEIKVEQDQGNNNEQDPISCDEGFILNDENNCVEVIIDEGNENPSTENPKPNTGSSNKDNKGTVDTPNGNTTGFKNNLDCTARYAKYNGETLYEVTPVYINRSLVSKLTTHEKQWYYNSCILIKEASGNITSEKKTAEESVASNTKKLEEAKKGLEDSRIFYTNYVNELCVEAEELGLSGREWCNSSQGIQNMIESNLDSDKDRIKKAEENLASANVRLTQLNNLINLFK